MQAFTVSLDTIEAGIALAGLGPTEEGPVHLALGAGRRAGQARRLHVRGGLLAADRLLRADVAGSGASLRLGPEPLHNAAARRVAARHALVLVRVFDDSPAGTPLTSRYPAWTPCPDRPGLRPTLPRAAPGPCLYCEIPYVPTWTAAGPGWQHPAAGWLLRYSPLADGLGITRLAHGWRPLSRGLRRRGTLPLGHHEILVTVAPRAGFRLAGLGAVGRHTSRCLRWIGHAWQDVPPGPVPPRPPGA